MAWRVNWQRMHEQETKTDEWWRRRWENDKEKKSTAKTHLSSLKSELITQIIIKIKARILQEIVKGGFHQLHHDVLVASFDTASKAAHHSRALSSQNREKWKEEEPSLRRGHPFLCGILSHQHYFLQTFWWQLETHSKFLHVNERIKRMGKAERGGGDLCTPHQHFPCQFWRQIWSHP